MLCGAAHDCPTHFNFCYYHCLCCVAMRFVSFQAGVLYRDAIVKMYVPNQALPFHCLSQVGVVQGA